MTHELDLLQMSQDEFLAIIEDMSTRGGEFLEECIAAGEVALQKAEGAQWFIGDMLGPIRTRYGKNTIKKVAHRLRRAVSTVYEWRQMSRFYPKSARAEFLAEKTLSYEHMRDAMRRLGNLDDASNFLRETAANARTVEEAQVELTALKGKPKPPVKVVDMQGTVKRVEGKTAVIEFEDYPDFKYQVYRFKTYELAPHEVES